MKAPAWISRFFELLRPPVTPAYPHPRRGPGCPQGIVLAGELHSLDIDVIDRRTGAVICMVKMVDVDAGTLVRYREKHPEHAPNTVFGYPRTAPRIMIDGAGEPVTETLKGPWGIRMKKHCKTCKKP